MTTEEKINLLCLRICPNYPDIQDVTIDEKLYAIESTYYETLAATNDYNKLIKVLQKKYVISDEEIEIEAKKILDKPSF